MQVVVLGLGRMGAGVAARLLAAGIDVSVWNRTPEKQEALLAAGAREFHFARAESVRVYWLALPAGSATDEVLTRLVPLLRDGDVVCNAANASWEDAGIDAQRVQPATYHDVGISGGVTGRDTGYALMVGGDGSSVQRLTPLWEALQGHYGSVHVGPVGAGHYAKMVHNAVEYGMLQAIGEGYELLARAPLAVDPPAAVGTWKTGSIVSGYLIDRLSEVVLSDPHLTGVGAQIDQTGEGERAHQLAGALGVADEVLATALRARASSVHTDRLQYRVVAALRRAFGGHAVYPPK